jgi:hypothetical protein
MSQNVDLAELLDVASEFGTVPMLLTVDASGRPRAAAGTHTWDGPVAQVHAGHRSVANARERPLVSLLWPAPPGQRFALLVDGEAQDVRDDPAAAVVLPGRPGRSPKAGGTITLRVTSALLHVVTR